MDILVKYFELSTIAIIRYFIVAGIPFLVFYKLFFANFIKNKIQENGASTKNFIDEIKNSMISTLTIVVLGVVVIETPLSQYTQLYTEIDTFPIWYIPVSIIISLIIHDTYFYWMHRTLHHPRLYKAVHLTHHKSVNPSPFASFSFHFYEAITEGMILPIMLFILPLHPLAIIGFTLSSFFINVYGHLGFEIMPKWFRHSFLFQIFNSSVHHNLHHSKFVGNYGLYFRVWDRVMGTEHPDYVAQYDLIQEKRFGKVSKNKQVQLA